MAKTKTDKSPAGARDIPKELHEFELGELPPQNDPKGRAEYLLQMLDAFAAHGTAEAKRIRAVLIETIDEYARTTEGVTGDERLDALARVALKLQAVEVGVMTIVKKSVTRVRDKIVEQARKLGAKTPDGQKARAIVAQLEGVGEAVEAMIRGAETGSAELRDRARAILEETRSKLED